MDFFDAHRCLSERLTSIAKVESKLRFPRKIAIKRTYARPFEDASLRWIVWPTTLLSPTPSRFLYLLFFEYQSQDEQQKYIWKKIINKCVGSHQCLHETPTNHRGEDDTYVRRRCKLSVLNFLGNGNCKWDAIAFISRRRTHPTLKTIQLNFYCGKLMQLRQMQTIALQRPLRTAQPPTDFQQFIYLFIYPLPSSSCTLRATATQCDSYYYIYFFLSICFVRSQSDGIDAIAADWKAAKRCAAVHFDFIFCVSPFLFCVALPPLHSAFVIANKLVNTEYSLCDGSV